MLTDEMATHESYPMSMDEILAFLLNGDIETEGLLPWSSNYAFLVTITQDDTQSLAVYKPRSGERPLWDFPDGTLCLREVATFVASQGLGWLCVPPTVLREGPHGIGSVQLFIDTNPEEHYFTLQDAHDEQFKYMSALDYIANNADRKGGHCLLGTDGHIWGVDHGLTFHATPKLRTVIWKYAGQPIPESMLEDILEFHSELVPGTSINDALEHLLASDELNALRQRTETLLCNQIFPDPDPSRRHIPWPPV